MGIVSGLVLIVLGGLCLPGLVAKRSPKAMEMLASIEPFQGWIGLVVFGWGTWGIISSILSLGIIGSWPLSWISSLAASVLNFAGGLILGFSMIQRFVLNRVPEEAQEKAGALRERLIAVQGPIGIAAIVVGIWVLLYTLVLRGILLI